MQTSAHPFRAARSPRGSVLIIVLWVAFGLVSVALYFAHSMSMEMRAADYRVASAEAEQAIEGAARYVNTMLTNNISIQPGVLPDPENYQREAVPIGDATYWFLGRQDQNVAASAISLTGTRSLVTSSSPQSQSPNGTALRPTFGLTDEAAKLNLNAAWVGTNVLLYLPRMTPQLAAAIVDWRDTNDVENDFGAESQTYATLKPPYLCKNAPFETVDELRMVYGMDMETLYGEDVNLNGVLDANEDDGPATQPYDNKDGLLDAGILSFVTVYSREPNTRTNGSTRVKVAAMVPQQQTGRGGRGGGRQPSAGQTNLMALLQEKNFSGDRVTQIVNAFYTGPATIRSTLQFYTLSGMTPDEFALIAPDITTVTNGTYIDGLVNINTASLEVLSCLPGIGPTNGPLVYQYRQANPSLLTSVVWLLNAIDTASALQAGPYITSQSYQVSADIVAVGHHGRGYRRVRYIFDTSDGTGKIRYRQDLTHLGWPLGAALQSSLLTSAKNSR